MSVSTNRFIVSFDISNKSLKKKVREIVRESTEYCKGTQFQDSAFYFPMLNDDNLRDLRRKLSACLEETKDKKDKPIFDFENDQILIVEINNGIKWGKNITDSQ